MHIIIDAIIVAASTLIRTLNFFIFVSSVLFYVAANRRIIFIKNIIPKSARFVKEFCHILQPRNNFKIKKRTVLLSAREIPLFFGIFLLFKTVFCSAKKSLNIASVHKNGNSCNYAEENSLPDNRSCHKNVGS